MRMTRGRTIYNRRAEDKILQIVGSFMYVFIFLVFLVIGIAVIVGLYILLDPILGPGIGGVLCFTACISPIIFVILIGFCWFLFYLFLTFADIFWLFAPYRFDLMDGYLIVSQYKKKKRRYKLSGMVCDYRYPIGRMTLTVNGRKIRYKYVVMEVPDLLLEHGVKVEFHKTDKKVKGFFDRLYKFNNWTYASIRKRMK
jgi:hypothetical protein